MVENIVATSEVASENDSENNIINIIVDIKTQNPKMEKTVKKITVSRK